MRSGAKATRKADPWSSEWTSDATSRSPRWSNHYVVEDSSVERASGFVPLWGNSGEDTGEDWQTDAAWLGSPSRPIAVDDDALEARDRDLLDHASRKKLEHDEIVRDQDLMAARGRKTESIDSSEKKGRGLFRIFGGGRNRRKGSRSSFENVSLASGQDVPSDRHVVPDPPSSTRPLTGQQPRSETPSNEDSTVSEMTNPTFFHGGPPKTIRGKQSKSPKKLPDPFDVAAFTSGDPFAAMAMESPVRGKFGTSPIASDDFSDPFFPSSSMACQDPDHIQIPPTGSSQDEEKKDDSGHFVMSRSTPPRVSPRKAFATSPASAETAKAHGETKRLEVKKTAGFLPVATARYNRASVRKSTPAPDPVPVPAPAPVAEPSKPVSSTGAALLFSRRSRVMGSTSKQNTATISSTTAVKTSEPVLVPRLHHHRAGNESPAKAQAGPPKELLPLEPLKSPTKGRAHQETAKSPVGTSPRRWSPGGTAKPPTRSTATTPSLGALEGKSTLVSTSTATKSPSAPTEGTSLTVEKTSVSPGMSEKLRKRQLRKVAQKADLIRETVEKQAAAEEAKTTPERAPYRGRLQTLRSKTATPPTAVAAPTPQPLPAAKRTTPTNPSPAPQKPVTPVSAVVSRTKPPVTRPSPPVAASVPRSKPPEKKRVSEPVAAKPVALPSYSAQGPYGNLRYKSRTYLQSSEPPRTLSLPPRESSSFSDDETRSFSTARSDIRMLRSYMRRSRLAQSSEPFRGSNSFVSAFSMRDESTVTDPMQRAGMRLLSAAVIPIQAAARRHLALHEALTRMWAIVVLQSLARRWIAQNQYYNKIIASVAIQAWYRGCRMRDRMLLEQCCAIEIQRFIRGYLATLTVYEDIFRITIVQSAVRRKQAIDRATDRMIFVIQLQSLARGFLARQRLLTADTAALIIQTRWRSFFCQFNYQLDLLDIIIVQSIWRRLVAMRNYENMLAIRDEQAVVMIQKHWRASEAREAFLELVAAVTIQAYWRAYCCRSVYAASCAATKIQARWRGFVASQWYLEFVAASMIQAQVRRFLCEQAYVEYMAARMIQTQVRRYLCESDYIKYVAARMIQTQVRRHLCQSAYIKYVAARCIQAQWRCFVDSQAYLRLIAAIIIQAQWRAYSFAKKEREANAATKIQAAWRCHVCSRDYLHYVASIMIQTHWRGFFCRRRYRDEVSVSRVSAERTMAAGTIQRVWRGFVVYANFMFTVADIVIVQSLARRMFAKSKANTIRYVRTKHAACVMQRFARDRLARKLRAALVIQAFWRGFVSKAEFIITMYETDAAVSIQKYWRRFLGFSWFIIAVDSVILIQAVFRGFRLRKDYCVDRFAATIIQKAFRDYASISFAQHRLIVNNIISMGYPIRDKERASVVTIQSVFRRHQARHVLTTYVKARIIQSFWRRVLARLKFVALRAELMADTIAAAVVVQKLWRGVLVRRTGLEFTYWQQRLFVFDPAATSIQTAWRGFIAMQDYWHALGSAIQIQGVIRSFIIRQRYRFIRRVVFTQATFRGWQVRREFQRLLACIQLQATFRMFLSQRTLVRQTSYKKMQIIAAKWAAAKWFHNEMAAMYLQSVFRRYLARVQVAEKLGSIILVQSLARSFIAKREVRSRRLIFMFVKTANSGASESKSAECDRHVSDWEQNLIQQRKADRAARKIQGFFKMVKAEVDREIRAQKKRRKKRKKQQRRPRHDAEDDVLENVWQSTVDEKQIAPEAIRQARDAVACELRSGHYRRAAKPMSERNTSDRNRQPPRPRTPSTVVDSSKHEQLSKSQSGSHYQAERQRKNNREYQEGEESVHSAGSYRFRIPPSRFTTLSRREIGQDFNLEEAWIDTEILDAKERRRKAKQHQRSSRHPRPPSRASTVSSIRTMEV